MIVVTYDMGIFIVPLVLVPTPRLRTSERVETIVGVYTRFEYLLYTLWKTISNLRK